MKRKSLILKVSILFYLMLFVNCKTNSYSTVVIDNNKYKKIYIYNDVDTLDGFYNVRKEGVYYISKWDIQNVDTIVCDNQILKNKPYLLFSFNWKETVSLREDKCNYKSNIFETRDIRNIFYPGYKINDNLYKFKHVANVYDSEKPTIREFLINKKMTILSFKTIKKNDENYFFYD